MQELINAKTLKIVVVPKTMVYINPLSPLGIGVLFRNLLM